MKHNPSFSNEDNENEVDDDDDDHRRRRCDHHHHKHIIVIFIIIVNIIVFIKATLICYTYDNSCSKCLEMKCSLSTNE
jgi:hypothetical protein